MLCSCNLSCQGLSITSSESHAVMKGGEGGGTRGSTEEEYRGGDVAAVACDAPKEHHLLWDGIAGEADDISGGETIVADG